MKFRFSARSEKLLGRAHDDLVRVLRRALSYGDMDFTIIDTLRDLETQRLKVAAGLSKTLKSKHLPGANGKARASDLAPWPIDWKDIPAFKRLAVVIKRAAEEERVKIVWGGDWRTFKDWGHYELA